MSKFDHLMMQAARAERLSRNILDTLTVDRLQAFAAECRAQARAHAEQQCQADSRKVRPAA
jgi:hypothetical protein